MKESTNATEREGAAIEFASKGGASTRPHKSYPMVRIVGGHHQHQHLVNPLQPMTMDRSSYDITLKELLV